MAEEPELDLSIVMPCLNEAETLERCVRKAQASLERLGLSGEVVVADNGSSDGSQELARRLGARVVDVAEKGYGSALRGGIEAARGRWVVMGDADDSYDFSALEGFVLRLRAGDELVMGNRFKGGIRPGAMPPLHRFLGNPVLTGIGRLLFRSPAGDFHCGLRAFSRAAYDRLGLQTTGMEFASEMVIAATLKGLRVGEVPIVLHKDGRSRPPHLRSWRDGWRHLRFMLMYSPDWLLLYPGLLLLAAGLLLGARLTAGPLTLGGVVLDIHTLLVAGCLAVFGHQLVSLALFAKLFAAREGFLPGDAWQRVAARAGLERLLVLGALLALAGAALLGAAVLGWSRAGFGPLDPRRTMREAVPAVTLLLLGLQTASASFVLGLLGLRRR